ncbi:MAG: Gfo/Idh/MocA family oxidoreductase [Ignavibacteriaceae bacterium]|nr:Gfo/Idh/MocA family oxidoreductase [Ignavibacteriaceae bacterium]
MENFRIAVIGLGSVAQLVHLPILKKMPGVAVLAAAELNKNRLKTVSDKYNISGAYTDYRQMLDEVEVDAVIIATPTSTHTEIAKEVISRKINLLIEKPISRTFREAKEVVDLAQKHKVTMMVGMNMRYRPDIMLLKSIANSGEIGELFYVKAGWLKKQSSESKWFTDKEKSGGGVVFDLGIVLLDVSLWLLDYPAIKAVSTHNFSHFTSSVEDTSISKIRCANNSLIFLESSWSIGSDRDSLYFDIYGSKGNASINPFRVFKRSGGTMVDMTPFKSESEIVLFKKSYQNEIKHFIGACKGLNPNLSPGNESLSRMRIIETMYQSSSEKKEIELKS